MMRNGQPCTATPHLDRAQLIVASSEPSWLKPEDPVVLRDAIRVGELWRLAARCIREPIEAGTLRWTVAVRRLAHAAPCSRSVADARLRWAGLCPGQRRRITPQGQAGGRRPAEKPGTRDPVSGVGTSGGDS